MPYKQFDIDPIGSVKIYKRRGSRSLRLTITSTGEARVSIPTWAPYSSGVTFARSKADWIVQHRAKAPKQILVDGQAVGKAHHLVLKPSATATSPATRIAGSEVVVTYPSQLSPESTAVQRAAFNAGIRALRSEAERLLDVRLRDVAAHHGYTYKNLAIKKLKGRWGSCDQDKHIVLNLFLMQLPWSLIDYVILHELAHTRVLHHGADFWQEFEEHLPNAKQLRKQIRAYQPSLVLQDIHQPVS
jgi:predicted metal-dependent hydrolase